MPPSPGPSAQQQPAQQPPPVQKLRVRYAKRGRLRFTSHRDFGRALERAVRRAGLPIAYSSGFSPHPRISYANASPTGAASEAEYLEISLVERMDPELVRRELDAALPDGLDVVDVVAVSTPGALADRLEVSRWRIALPGVAPSDAQRAVVTFLASPGIEVERMTKRGLRRFDCREAVVRLRVLDESDDASECAILEVVARHGTPAVRPEDILAGLRAVAGLDLPTASLSTRMEQGPLDPETGTVLDPLDPDRDEPPGRDR